MIHVDAQPEPPSFDTEVRKQGVAWLQRHGIPLDQPLLRRRAIAPIWTKCLDDLYEAYNGCCAYLAIHIERVTGGRSVDHFIAKSKRPDLAYEWSNYRLTCTRMNARKRDRDDVLDPFEVETGWFRLELVSGRIYPSPDLEPAQERLVQATIDRLGLDDGGNRAIRAEIFQGYLERFYTAEFLRLRSPFVWHEANREGLL